MPPWHPVRTKVHVRMAIQRIQTLREKKEALAKAARRDIATLIERKRLETARIKVENIIHDDTYVELLEIMELYSEILSARFGLLENGSSREPDPGVREAIVGIVYAAHRTEIKELHFVRESLMNRFGREWAINVMENRDSCVSSRVTEKLTAETPPASLVDAYLGTIAEGYGLSWSPPAQVDASVDAHASLGTKGEEISQAKPLDAKGPPEEPNTHKDKSPSEDVSADDVNRTVQPPAATSSKPSISRSTSSVANPSNGFHPTPKGSPPSYSNVAKSDGRRDGNDDDDDDLLRRFEALKTRR